MPYEIDFIGINEDSKDATAIAMRWEKPGGGYTVGIVDGGFQAHGEALANLLETYYFPNGEKEVIDFVICSHPHDDHIQGLKTILENFTVRNLYMNRPWRHVEKLYLCAAPQHEAGWAGEPASGKLCILGGAGGAGY